MRNPIHCKLLAAFLVTTACTDSLQSEEPQNSGDNAAMTKEEPRRIQGATLTSTQTQKKLFSSRLPSLASLVDEQIPLALRRVSLDVGGTGGAGGAPGISCPTDGAITEECRVFNDVKQRFFTSGPTAFMQTLASVDERLSQLWGPPAEERYFPCLDTDATETRTLDGEEFAPYEAITFDLERSFLDGSSFDPEQSYVLSCAAASGGTAVSADSESWLALGEDSLSYYIVDAQKEGPSTLSIVGPGQRLEVWSVIFSIGEESGIRADFDELVQSEIAVRPDARGIDETIVSTYGGSTGVVHLLADNDAGFFELTATGSNMGSGCGMQLQIRDDFLLYRENANPYGRCSASDYTDSGFKIYDLNDAELVEYGADAPFNYDSTQENFGENAFCFDVSGIDPEPVGLADCLDAEAGLTQNSAEELASVFELPLLVRSQDQASFATVESISAIRAYNSRYLLSSPPVGLNPLRSLTAEQLASAEVEGTSTEETSSEETEEVGSTEE